MSFEVIKTQEELDNIISERLKREREKLTKQFADYDELKAKNIDLEKQVGDLTKNLEDLKAGNGDFEKTISDLQGEVKSHKLSELKIQYALENGIPYNLATRISGEDEDSIRADAKSLSKYFEKEEIVPPLKNPEINKGQSGAYKELLQGLNLED